jgi:hypothetical protein
MMMMSLWCRTGIRAFWGLDKNKISKGVLVGPRSRACHVLLYSVYFNSILASGGNDRAIGLV